MQKTEQFKRAGWISIINAVFLTIFSYSGYILPIIGALITVYLFYCFKRLLNEFFCFNELDNYLMLFMIISLILPILGLFPSNLFFKIISVGAIVKGVLIGMVGFKLQRLEDSLFRTKKMLCVTLKLMGLSTVFFGLYLTFPLFAAYIPIIVNTIVSIINYVISIILFAFMGKAFLSAKTCDVSLIDKSM